MSDSLQDERDAVLRQALRDHHAGMLCQREQARLETAAERESNSEARESLHSQAADWKTRAEGLREKSKQTETKYRTLDDQVQREFRLIPSQQRFDAAQRADFDRKGQIFLEETGKTKSELARHNAVVSLSWMERGCIEENGCKEPFKLRQMSDWFTGTDFSHSVKVEAVHHHVQNRNGSYFSKVGASADSVGINSSRPHFEIRDARGIKMLSGHAAAMKDHFSKSNNVVDTHGGGIQYLPHSNDKMRMPVVSKCRIEAKGPSK